MYRKYFGLNSLPFKTTPDLDMFYKHGSRQEILEALIYTISRGDGIIKVTGEVGSGKTMLLRLLADSLPDYFEVIYINSPNLSSKDILLYICSELGLDLPSDSQKFTLTNALKNALLSLYSQNKKVVMLVDEAQTMTFDALEELRLLSNIETGDDKLLQMVLFGQPELDKAIEHDDIRQLKSRISYNIYVPPLKASDVQAYLNYRMHKAGYSGVDVFSLSISNKIQKLTSGLPRNINIVADKVLMSVFGSGDKVAKSKHLKYLPELDDLSQKKTNNWFVPTLLLSVVLLIVLLSIFYLYDRSSDKPISQNLKSELKENGVYSGNKIQQTSKINDDTSKINVAKDEGKSLKTTKVLKDSADNHTNIVESKQEIVNEVLLTEPPLEEKSAPNSTTSTEINQNIKNPNAIVGNPAQLMEILRYHNEGKKWLETISDNYVIQLSTRHIRSIESTLKFYHEQGFEDGTFHILIDYNETIDKFRLKVFYLTSSRFSVLNNIIESLPYKIRSSSPYIERIEQLKQNVNYTDRKLEDIGIVNE
ncbi:hypothetical protein JCM30760_19200 [Thiomicrorhabdus hydrogeniphila]